MNDIPIGGISCRVEERNGKTSLYVLILSVLPKYRRGQIATKLLLEILKRVGENKEDNIHSVYLHTPIHNSAAITFYEKNGFKIVENLKDYYKSLPTPEENEAVVLERIL